MKYENARSAIWVKLKRKHNVKRESNRKCKQRLLDSLKNTLFKWLPLTLFHLFTQMPVLTLYLRLGLRKDHKRVSAW